MRKSDCGWRDSKSGKTRYAYFKDLSESKVKLINTFRDNFATWVILSLNKNIENSFADELDYCIALDFNFEKTKTGRTRTGIGQSVYEAKQMQSRKALKVLVDDLLICIKDIDKLLESNNKCLSHVPVKSSKQYDVPRELVKMLSDDLCQASIVREVEPIVHAELKIRKPTWKNLPVSRKVQEWKRIFDQGGVKLGSSVSGAVVYIVDDLYQSGATIWSYASYLKSQGAEYVVGFVCEKTWSDKDNI